MLYLYVCVCVCVCVVKVDVFIGDRSLLTEMSNAF